MPTTTHPLRVAAGALNILGDRVRTLGHLGLTLWSSTGTAALKQHRASLGAATAQLLVNEQAEIGLAAQLREILADGAVDEQELARLKRMPRTLSQCAARNHDVAQLLDPA